MPGLINIAYYGANELYLTGAPQITMFKTVYRRYTNFSKESVAISLGNIDFNKEVEIELLQTGDLIGSTYLQLEIPAVNIEKIHTLNELSDYQTKLLLDSYKTENTDPNYIVNYNLVKRFMQVNMEGYRKAESDSIIKNQNVEQYIQSILEIIQQKEANLEPELIQNYQIILTESMNNEMVKLNINKSNEIQITNQYNQQISQISNENTLLKLKTQYEAQMKIIKTERDIIYNNISLLDYKSSSIYYILTSLSLYLAQNTTFSAYGFSNVSDITINNVLILLRNAVNSCVKITNYYFENVKNITKKTNDENSRYAKFAWVKKLGYAIIDYVEVKIGGETIDKHYGMWMNIWNELTMSADQTILHNKMIGNVQSLVSYDRNQKSAYTLYIPLQFWFCKRPGLAFPIVALQNNSFIINIKLKKIEDCAYIEKIPVITGENSIDFSENILQLTDIWNNYNLNLTGYLLVDFIYLEDKERSRFARSAHEYLIETVDTIKLENLSNNKQNIELNFSGLSKEIFWACQKTEYINNYNSNYESLWFNYSIDKHASQNPVLNANLSFASVERFNNTQNYFNLVQPYQHHTSIPSYGINCYSFSLTPEEHQPSGIFNFTKIAYPKINLNIHTDMFEYNLSDIDPDIDIMNDKIYDTDVNLTFFSLRYQVLRIISGMAAFAFY